MINPELGYSDKTQALIERQCRNVERKSFRLQKDKAAEAILKTYDLFDLPRPKRVVWCADPFTSVYQGSARSALDYDFDYYIIQHEYIENPDEDLPVNDNDHKYLAYCELLMEAKEHGAGYRVEWEDTLYIVPTPLVVIDSQNRFHNEDGPAIRWKQGKSFYFLYGESFEKELWERVTSGNFTAKELMAIEDTDKRAIAMTYLAPADMIEQMHMKLLHVGIKGNKLYECKNYLDSGETEYALWMKDASTPRQFIHFVPKDFDFHKNADEATAGCFRNGGGDLMPLEDYLLIEQEA